MSHKAIFLNNLILKFFEKQNQVFEIHLKSIWFENCLCLLFSDRMRDVCNVASRFQFDNNFHDWNLGKVYKHDIYDLPNDLRLMILGNYEKSGKS